MSVPNSPEREIEALIGNAQGIAEAIILGRVTPYDGGRRIWRECQLNLKPGDHRLDPFVYWASEYEETKDPERQALCEKAIRAAASMLVQLATAL
jgi:hypothetical protein